MKRLLCMLLCFTVLMACSKKEPVQASDDARLTVAIASAPKTLDPRYATDATGMRLTHQLMYDTLLSVGNDLQMHPKLASQWELVTPTQYRIYVRKDAKFHDGSVLNAHDVAYTFRTLKDPDTASPFAATYKIIKELRVVDDHTVDFILTEPKAAFPVDLSMAILSRSGDASLGSGPFMLDSSDAQQVVLKANPNYWGGAPKVDALVFKIIKDDSTRVLKTLKGDIDLVINELPRDQIDKFAKHDDFEVVVTSGIAYQYLALNFHHKDLRKLPVRQAIAHALNVPEIIEYRIKGQATPAHGLFSSVNWFDNPSVKQFGYDPQAAIRLLEEAGYEDPDGDGPKPRLQLTLKTSNNPEVVGVARIIKAQLAEVGIALDLRSFEWGTFYGDVSKGNFMMASMRWVGVTEPDFYYAIFHSTQFPPEGRNRGYYRNPEVDHLAKLGRVEGDREKRKAIYGKLQAIVAEDLPYISLWHNNNITVQRKRVRGFTPHPNGGFYSLKQVALQNN